MQGTAAQAQEENNSSLIWGVVGSLWQGFSLHWTSAVALLPGSGRDFPWLPAGVGAPGAVLYLCNRLRQLPSLCPAVGTPCLESLRALTLSSRSSPGATSSKKTSLITTAVSSGAFYTQPWSQSLGHMSGPSGACDTELTDSKMRFLLHFTSQILGVLYNQWYIMVQLAAFSFLSSP